MRRPLTPPWAPTVRVCGRATVILAVALLVASCTRSDGYVVIYNGCDVDVVVVGLGDEGSDVVPAGEAHDYLSEEPPIVTVDLPGGREVPVDFGAWHDTWANAPNGDVVVDQAVCDGEATPVFTNQTGRYLDDTYGSLLTD